MSEVLFEPDDAMEELQRALEGLERTENKVRERLELEIEEE